ncbi:MAG: sulfatase-like hydrolase/transferase [Solirubrobacterales bacterium]|nr:sulfatase-like hydrolase/transferase [Solirubrobacterales bacterium]
MTTDGDGGRGRGGLSRRELIGAAGIGALGVAGAGAAGWHAIGGAEAASERRNVVLIIVDSLRADHVRSFGAGGMRTPNIDELARGGMRFTSVYPEAMPTMPARRSIMSGRRAYPFRNWQPWLGMAARPGWQPIKPGAETLVSAMRRAGWWTTYVTDNPFLGYSKTLEPFRRSPHRFVRVEGQRGERRPRSNVSRAAALRRLPPGPLRNEDRINALRQYIANNGTGRDEAEQAASRVFRHAAKQLRTAKSKGRFLMVVDCFDPHEPWTPPRRYLDMYGDPDYRGYEIATVAYTHASNYLSPRHIARLQTTYKAAVTMTDHWLGYFLDRLWKLGLDDSTAIALVSDHGVFVGERNWTGKGPARLYPELTHVPLIVREPGGAGAGGRSDWFASTHDVAPTLVSLAGVKRPPAFEGADLSPILEGGEPDEDRPYAVGGYGNNSYVRDDRWAYQVQNDWRDERLYDKRADPGERVNVAARRPAVVREMRRRVIAAAGGKRPPMYSDAYFDRRKRSSFG